MTVDFLRMRRSCSQGNGENLSVPGMYTQCTPTWSGFHQLTGGVPEIIHQFSSNKIGRLVIDSWGHPIGREFSSHPKAQFNLINPLLPAAKRTGHGSHSLHWFILIDPWGGKLFLNTHRKPMCVFSNCSLWTGKIGRLEASPLIQEHESVLPSVHVVWKEPT